MVYSKSLLEERRPDSQHQSSRYIVEIIVTLLDSPEMPGTASRQRFVCVFRLDHRPEEGFPGQSSQEQTASPHHTWFTDKALQALKELLSRTHYQGTPSQAFRHICIPIPDTSIQKSFFFFLNIFIGV